MGLAEGTLRHAGHARGPLDGRVSLVRGSGAKSQMALWRTAYDSCGGVPQTAVGSGASE